MRAQASSILLGAIFTAGCSFTMTTNGTTTGATTESRSPSETRTTNAPRGNARPELQNAYDAINWKDYTGQYGYRLNGAPGGVNLQQTDRTGAVYKVGPDPVWLARWNINAIDSTSGPYILAQAGINRTWQKQCFDDYAAYRDGWKALDKKYRPNFKAATQISNFYEQRKALNDLFGQITSDAKDQGLELANAHPGRWTGLRWEILVALIKGAQANKVDFALGGERAAAQSSLLPVSNQELGEYMKFGRTAAGDDDFERDAFCDAAGDSGTQRSAKLPMPQAGNIDLSMVEFPVSKAREKTIKSKLKELEASGRPTLTEYRIPPLRQGEALGLAATDKKEPKLYFVGGKICNGDKCASFVVQSIDSNGGQKTLNLLSRTTNGYQSDCRETNKVESISEDGRLNYERTCGHNGTYHVDAWAHVTFADLPSSIPIEKGDEVDLYADLVSSKQSPNSGGPDQNERTDYTFTGRYLVSAKKPTKQP
jgi:hypothetical protein